jgi:iron complex outermembrane recepter protein
VHRNYSSHSCWIAGIVMPTLFAIAQPTLADSSTTPTASRLSEVPRPAKNLKNWRSQAPDLAPSTPVQVTGVRLSPVTGGVEIILETTEGARLQATTRTDGNTLIANIPNAILALPSEAQEFRQANPVEGITAITAIQADATTLQVRVTGKKVAPAGEVISNDAGLVLSATLSGSPPTDEAAQAEEGEQEIVVTAEKAEENVQDVPISITPITEQEIEDADISSLEDIAANVPNFSTFSSGTSRSFLNYSIRGLSNAGVLNRDSAAFYVDDVPYDNGNFLDIDLTDLERVEVLRGPQGTLYGRSSIAGVVNIVTQKPTNTFEFKSNVGYGNFSAFDLGASVSGPILKDELFYRISGSYGSQDGFTTNTFLDDDVDDQSGGNGRLQLLWRPIENWEFFLSSSYDNYQDGSTPFQILGTEPFEVSQNIRGFSDLTSNSQSIRAAYTGPNIRFTSITARRFSRNNEAFDGDFSPLDALEVQADASSTVYSQEFRFQSPRTTDRFQWLAGGYLELRDFSIDSGVVLGSVNPLQGTNLTASEVQETTAALFGQVSYKPVKAITLTAGLRFETNNSDLDVTRTFTPTGFPVSIPVGASFSDLENDSNALLPRFVAEYRFSQAAMAYASITAGYRPAGVNFQATTEEAVPFNAERSWNYEVGLKTSWFKNRLTANLAFFHNSVDDFQVTFFDPSRGATFVTNAGASITGGEFELRATPIKGLDIIAGLGLVEGELTDLTNPFTGEQSDTTELVYAPDLTYNVAVQYRSPIGLFGRLEVVGFGTTVFDEDNTIQQDPFALVNVRLGYEFKNVGIYLFANNIFDNEYISRGFLSGSTAVVSYGAPATYGVQIKTRF